MAWTKKQKLTAIRACEEAGISEEQRRDLILRNFEHAHYQGKITSTAPKLSNEDFEAFMAIVEHTAGGKVLHFSAGYWQACADDRLSRMRGRTSRIAAALEAAGKLAADGVGLAGWIAKRVSQGAAQRVEELEYHGLLALILGLQAYADQNGVAWERGAQ